MSYISKPVETSEDYGKYIQYIANLDISSREKYELLYILNSLLSYFVDQAFGVQTDQITLAHVHKTNSISKLVHDILHQHPEILTAHAPSNGLASDSNSLGTS